MGEPHDTHRARLVARALRGCWARRCHRRVEHILDERPAPKVFGAFSSSAKPIEPIERMRLADRMRWLNQQWTLAKLWAIVRDVCPKSLVQHRRYVEPVILPPGRDRLRNNAKGNRIASKSNDRDRRGCCFEREQHVGRGCVNKVRIATNHIVAGSFFASTWPSPPRAWQ
jgi:hypothetical protein